MKAFWWFEENAIAGMARPGFNQVHWFDLPFDEAVAMGWVGQHSSGSVGLENFRHHLKEYAPKIFPFYGLGEEAGLKALEVFSTEEGFEEVLKRLAARTLFLNQIRVEKGEVHLEICHNRLGEEIDFLRENGIKRIVSLTEKHHGKDSLGKHFSLHHFSIEDLNAPTYAQVQELAEIIVKAKRDKEAIAVHCLAGIGRTSTMIMSAHLLLGAELPELLAKVKERNPRFAFVGSQSEFVKEIAAKARKK